MTQRPHANFGAPLTALQDFVRLWRARAPADGWSFARDRAAIIGGLAALAGLAALLLGLAWLVDERAARAVRALPRTVVKVFDIVTRIGESGWLFAVFILIAAAAAMLAARADRPRLRAGFTVLSARAFYIVVVLAASGLMSQIVKRVVGRARPKLLDTAGVFHFDGFSIHATLASFPSGHATTAFAVATALALFLPRWQAPLFITAAAVGLSRVVVGAHYPSDVLGGVAVGTLVAIAVARAFARRDIVFTTDRGRLERRGEGLVRPALRSLFDRTAT
jgi:membrane-associated phospholipid phosphatase